MNIKQPMKYCYNIDFIVKSIECTSEMIQNTPDILDPRHIFPHVFERVDRLNETAGANYSEEEVRAEILKARERFSLSKEPFSTQDAVASFYDYGQTQEFYGRYENEIQPRISVLLPLRFNKMRPEGFVAFELEASGVHGRSLTPWRHFASAWWRHLKQFPLFLACLSDLPTAGKLCRMFGFDVPRPEDVFKIE